MSSYISSNYYIEHAQLQNIENQCKKELEKAKAKVEAGRQAMLELLNKEGLLISKENERHNTVLSNIVKDDVQREQDHVTMERLLEQLDMTIRDYEQQYGTNTEFEDSLQSFKTSFEMFGPSEHLREEITNLLDVEIPEHARRYVDETDRSDLRRHMETVADASMHINDSSTEFVSLKQVDEEKENMSSSPWDTFMERLTKLVQQQEKFGGIEAEELLEAAEQIDSEGLQNLFILKNTGKLEEMEAEMSEMQKSENVQNEKKESLYNQYLSVCLLCKEVPAYSEKTEQFLLEKEYNRLWKKYQKLKEQQYVTNAFHNVFKKYNVSFEAMNLEENGMMQLQYSMDDQTGIRVSRSESGAFEMQFTASTTSGSPSMDEKRRMVEKANGFCKLLPKITEELEQMGIKFDQSMVQEPSAENIEGRHSRLKICLRLLSTGSSPVSGTIGKHP